MSRRPTYACPLRLARFVLLLARSPEPLTFDEAQDALGIGPRTFLRYLAACRAGLGEEIILGRRGEQRTVTIASTALSVVENPWSRAA